MVVPADATEAKTTSLFVMRILQQQTEREIKKYKCFEELIRSGKQRRRHDNPTYDTSLNVSLQLDSGNVYNSTWLYFIL